MATIDRNDIFDLAYRFITETNESIFLTGKAGTGKTTFLKYLQQHTAKNMIVAAPTGVAAINAGGVTLHSLFQLPFHPFLPTASNLQELPAKVRYQKQRLQLLRKMELLVIDEISMVRCDVLDAIDTLLKSVRHNYVEPFGGVQLLFIGDLFQLPPVARQEEWSVLSQYYASPFFFDSMAVKELSPLLIELTTIYRQKEDRFVSLLNKVRNNNLEPEDFDVLNERFIPDFRPADEDNFITLTSHNNQANQINQVNLNRLLSPAYSYEATIDGEFPENNFPADATLILKKGTQVMFLKNDPVEKKYFNGKIGIVSFLSDDKIIVTSNDEDIEVRREAWESIRYTLNPANQKLTQEVLGTFIQYPLRQAWAVTIHKSQGLTFDNVMIDAAAAFTSGQVYVALSRCTRLEGIVLLSKIPPKAIYCNEQVVAAQAAFVPKGSLSERFTGARQVFTLQQLHDIFSLESTEKALRQLMATILKYQEKFNEEAVAWVRSLLEDLNGLKATCQKFLLLAQQRLKEEPFIENNPLLQQRIQDAAVYFIPLLQSFKTRLQQHPLTTEYKEAAVPADDALAETFNAFNRAQYLMEYCKNPFTIAGYLRHRLNQINTRLPLSSYAASQKQTVSTSDMPQRELFNTLKQWRDNICNIQQLPIYMVATNNSLKEIVTYLPLSIQHLQKISGFGKAKAAKYGNEIIGIVSDYCEREQLDTQIEQLLSKPGRRSQAAATKAEKVSSAAISLQMYQQGKTIESIAAERKLAYTTIEEHLTRFVKTGEVTVSDFLPQETIQIISQAIRSNPPAQTITELKQSLDVSITYGNIRMVKAWMEYTDAAKNESAT